MKADIFFFYSVNLVAFTGEERGFMGVIPYVFTTSDRMIDRGSDRFPKSLKAVCARLSDIDYKQRQGFFVQRSFLVHRDL